ncbi:hypothetical protein SLS59_008880 [Nothophoma quercina]|uniref:Uncharacterized protein n=1 Tax=Nothophoma quercina TaxID=749835 RepID=A0ABR3QQ34_9PLEO
MFARSVVEYLFLCRKIGRLVHEVQVLTIYSGALSAESIIITHDHIGTKISVALIAGKGHVVILRGKRADTEAEATVLFVKKVLKISKD